VFNLFILLFKLLFIVIKFYLDPTKKSVQRLVGDVDYNEAKNVASVITPVPGMCFLLINVCGQCLIKKKCLSKITAMNCAFLHLYILGTLLDETLANIV
jgi:hypothetical protein